MRKSLLFKRLFGIYILSMFSMLSCVNEPSSQDKPSLAPSALVIDEYHGQKIKDPYRNAENLEDSNVKKWIAEQNEFASNHLNIINKTDYLVNKQREFDESKLYSISKLKVTDNDKHFYLKILAQENVSKLYYRESFDSKEDLLFDPGLFRPEKKIEYLINYIKPDWTGSKIVVSITEKGKEISELLIIDVKTKKISDEILTNSWVSEIGGITWLPDNSGFIYVYHPTIDTKSPNFLKNTKSVIYSLGDEKDNLTEVFSKNHNQDLDIKEEDFPTVSLRNSFDTYFVGQNTGAGTYNDAYFLPVENVKSKNWKPLFKKSDQIKKFIINKDSLYFISSKNTPNFEIRKTSLKNLDLKNSEILVKEKKDTIITDFSITSEGLYFVTSKNGIQADLFKLKAKKESKIEFPYVFGNMVLSAKSVNHPELWITTRGWLTQSIRYEYQNDALTNKSLNLFYEDEELNDITIEEVEVTAHDGEKIPLSLIYKKSLVKDGNNVAMIDGYGAYGVSMVPFFSLRRLLWVKEGGVYAIAHVRGGGEKGDAWHKGGFKTTKPNTWKDFISCAEYLIDNKFTSNDKLAIWSGSAGGIMIGRAITTKPDLFKAAIVEFGSLNTLRSESRPNGANSVKEYGTIKDSLEFEGIKEMDAYHHIKKGTKYPATLLTAGLNDPRVPAWFSVKFAAKMQASNSSENPNFLLIDSETGHGTDDTKLKEFERYANILSFALWQTGHPDYQPKN